MSWNHLINLRSPPFLGHAPRERVSWNWKYANAFQIVYRHAPRERVSWNIGFNSLFTFPPVTLHVSVWVEIVSYVTLLFQYLVTLHVSVWVEIGRSTLIFSKTERHAPRERVSWNSRPKRKKPPSLRHAPRERVSWNSVVSHRRIFRPGHAPRERVSWNLENNH